MSARTIKLLSPSDDLLATGQVALEGDHFAGSLDLTPMPAPLLGTFQEFEAIVNGQIFSLLDDMEQRIHELAIKVAFDDGSEAFVADLQIYPSTGLASFVVRPAHHASLGRVTNGQEKDSSAVSSLCQERQLPDLT